MKYILVILVMVSQVDVSFSQNLGFENGFTDYSLFYGTNNQVQRRIFVFRWCANKGITGETAGINSPMHHKIMDNNIPAEQFDPVIGGNILPTVIEGQYSARIGSRGLGYIAQKLVKTIAINAQNSTFKFNYALVTFDPSDHNKCIKPYFQLKIKKANGNKIYEEKIIADNNNPYFKKRNGFIYKDWDCKSVDLSRYEGKTLTFEFTTASCSEGAPDHLSYVYIDGLNSDVLEPVFSLEKNTFCVDDNDIIAVASDTKGETDHFWSIQESDSNWNGVPNTEVSKWFNATQAGILNLKDFYQSFGRNFKCNTHYRIKLAVKNNCIGWKETTQLIYFSCPIVNAGRDKCCCLEGQILQNVFIGDNSLPQIQQYKWTPNLFISNDNTNNTEVLCSDLEFVRMNYVLTATDVNGCTLSDEVSVFCGKPKGQIVKEKINCCSYKLKLRGEGIKDIVWSTGETDVYEIIVEQPGEYSVGIFNACGDEVVKTIIPNSQFPAEFKRIYPKIISGNSFTPNNDGVNDELVLFHYASNAPNIGQPVAYNATEYKLFVVDRGGIVHEVSSGTTCTGFKNGEIKWDGKINGQLVQLGTYTFFLKLRNCSYPWVEAEIVTGIECVRCGFSIADPSCSGFFRGCKEYKDIKSTRPHVNVIR